jgi:hypothetical protein
VFQRVWVFGKSEWDQSGVLVHNKRCYEQPDLIPPESNIEEDETPHPN